MNDVVNDQESPDAKRYGHGRALIEKRIKRQQAKLLKHKISKLKISQELVTLKTK